MHSDSSEPSEGAALPVSRGISTAEKRAEYERLGLEWPKYPDGTNQLWYRDPERLAGGSWKGWEYIQNHRAAQAAWTTKQTSKPGECGTKDCHEPKQRFKSGRYSSQCITHGREGLRKTNRRRRGWYDEAGMTNQDEVDDLL